MIEILLTNDSIYNEPGPNMLWVGESEDFLRLLRDIHELGIQDDVIIKVKDLRYINLQNGLSIILRSTVGGNVLLEKADKGFEINLDKVLWREVSHKILSITYESSFNFIEFDDITLKEEANIIITTEILPTITLASASM